MSIEVYQVKGRQCDVCDNEKDLLEINVNNGNLIYVFCNNCIDIAIELMEKLKKAR